MFSLMTINYIYTVIELITNPFILKEIGHDARLLLLVLVKVFWDINLDETF